MKPALLVEDPGPLATIQDRGRFGWQRFGVATAGAADCLAFDVANRLVGNRVGTACVELTLAGGSWMCEAESARLAVTGGDFVVTAAERRVPAWRSVTLRRGERLAIASAPDCARGYLAAAGGFAVAPELGSCSVHLRSGLGGGPIRRGDRVPLVRDKVEGRDLALDARLLPPPRRVLRAVPGPQDDYFSDAAIATFLGSEFRVTAEADRMGIKLAGPRIAHARGFNVLSDGVAPGSVQVPGSGQPIVLGPDRQTTGGYPKIATVITADLAAIGQLRPGDLLRFGRVTLGEARTALAERDAMVERLLAAIAPIRDDGGFGSDRLLSLNLIDGVVDAVHGTAEPR